MTKSRTPRNFTIFTCFFVVMNDVDHHRGDSKRLQRLHLYYRTVWTFHGFSKKKKLSVTISALEVFDSMLKLPFQEICYLNFFTQNRFFPKQLHITFNFKRPTQRYHSSVPAINPTVVMSTILFSTILSFFF